MVVLDTSKSNNFSGSGVIPDGKKMKFLQISSISCKINLQKGEYNIKFVGLKNAGNGLFYFKIQDVIDSKFNFINRNININQTTFRVESPGEYKFCIFRDGTCLGTIQMDLIKIVKISELPEEVEPKEVISIKSFSKVNLKPVIPTNAKYFFIDTKETIHQNLYLFARQNNIPYNSLAVINLFSDNYKNKKYMKGLDVRVFNSYEDILDFISICNPDLIISFDRDISFSNSYYFEDYGKLEKTKTKDLTFSFDGELL